MALRAVYEIAQVVRIPIVGIGGVSSLDDVLDFLAAGATAVGLATAALADPELPGRLGRELAGVVRAGGSSRTSASSSAPPSQSIADAGQPARRLRTRRQP